MTILVLGGRGKTASRLSLLLHNAGVSFLVGSSSTSHVGSYKMTHFDWLNEDTWTNGFLRASLDGMDPISAVYLVGGHAPELVGPGLQFINFARAQGVNRFVLLSASNVDKGTHSMGILHAHLDSLEDVQYVVLRPTWFMGKFPKNTSCRKHAEPPSREPPGGSASRLDQGGGQDLLCYRGWQDPIHLCR
jgi:festuclavine dehydrogenase